MTQIALKAKFENCIDINNRHRYKYFHKYNNKIKGHHNEIITKNHRRRGDYIDN